MYDKTFKYGEIFQVTEPVVFNSPTFGEEVIAPKGSHFVVGFDELFHNIQTGKVQLIIDASIEGMCSNGIVAMIMHRLESESPLMAMLNASAKERFAEIITEVLAELGIYKNKV